MAVERPDRAVLLEPVEGVVHLPVRHPGRGEEVVEIHHHPFPAPRERVEGAHHVVALPLHLPSPRASDASERSARPEVRPPAARRAALRCQIHRQIVVACHGKTLS